MSWQDGLAAAIELVGKEVELDCYTQVKGVKDGTLFFNPHATFRAYPDWQVMAKAIREENYDAYLFFADLTRPALIEMAGEKPTALCFTGGFAQSSASERIGLFFVESAVYLDRFRREGRNTIQAFGTNTRLFRPLPKQQKHWDAIFPATFADWKRHKLFAEALGPKGMACGWLQDHEPWCYNECFEQGVLVLPHIPAYALPFLYAGAHTCVITSNSAGGSQRTVLEAMACACPVIVMEDSDKTSEYVREGGGGFIVRPEVGAIREAIGRAKELGSDVRAKSREYILGKYSERHYAAALVEGLKSIV